MNNFDRDGLLTIANTRNWDVPAHPSISWSVDRRPNERDLGAGRSIYCKPAYFQSTISWEEEEPPPNQGPVIADKVFGAAGLWLHPSARSDVGAPGRRQRAEPLLPDQNLKHAAKLFARNSRERSIRVPW